MVHSTVPAKRFAMALTLLAVLSTAARSQDAPHVLVVHLEDQLIHPITVRFLTRALHEAADRGDQCVILMFDTPGGRMDSTRNLVKEILISDVPVVVYIAPSGARAGSAGVFVALAAHKSAMAPGTNIGTAHPIAAGGPPLPGVNEPHGMIQVQEILSERITNDAAAWARALAEYRFRNVDWAVRAVRESISTPAKQAQEEHVVDYLAADLSDLLNQLHDNRISLPNEFVVLKTRGAIIERIEMSWPERLLSLLANPTLAYLLLLLGFAGLMFEITHPGSWVPGILGLSCLVVAFVAMQMLPINYAGLALLILGLLLVALEVKVHSYGILTISGILCLLLGSAMLIEPSGGIERVSWLVVAPVTLAVSLILLLLVSNVVRIHKTPVKTGIEGLIGNTARVRGDMDGVGYVYVAGELWRARCDQPLQDGETVRIQGYEGLTLFVKPVVAENIGQPQ